MLFGEKIRQLRKEKNMSIKELSELTNLSSITIYNYEKGKTKPIVNNIGIIAKVLECDYDYLYGLAFDKQNGIN